ncbi:hypothetical protein [Parerythrobacter lacustris]|uniref:DUF11 domain-containing protein n=1 Tax=Parerythrobacter lacustris TaxID=2969984 RepID=A0ABT1XMY4_9SPHN|nr:hypothetical protein [Parerythrobacter lacustris]MCR2832947.1 hypothetical protein [Parerythrobacter lacustris]
MAFLLKILAPALSLALFAGPTVAQEMPISIEVDLKLEKSVVDADGNSRVERVEPDLIVPGDRLVFGRIYRNSGPEAVPNFVVTSPVSSAVRLAPDADPSLVVSVDGGKSWGVLSALTVAAEDGSARPADHADVTHVRWTLAMVAPGETGRLEFPAIIR